MTTLTYEDWLDIRKALAASQNAPNALLRKVDDILKETREFRSLDDMEPNAETLEAMREENLPTYATVQDAMNALHE